MNPVALLVVALAVASGAQAQTAEPQASGANVTFDIRGFDVQGDIPLQPAEVTAVLAPYVRKDGTLETLQQAATALEAALKARGFGLHRVVLPPQEVGESIRLSVVKFVIGAVTVEGAGAFGDVNIRASLPELQEGQSPNFRSLSVQTALANENPSKQVQVLLKESDQLEKIDARLMVKTAPAVTFAASLANTGSAATGADRLSLVGGHANLFGRDHQASFAYTTSIERAERVKQLGLSYSVPLYGWGGMVAFNYTNSDVEGHFGTFNSSGAGDTYSLSYSHYLPPQGGRKSYLTLGIEDKLFKAGKINGMVIPGQLDRGSRPASLGYSAKTESDAGDWGYGAELALNLPGSPGNDLSAYQTEESRIDTDQWKVLRLNAHWRSTLPRGWRASVRSQMQTTNNPLISGEQMGLGGVGSVRGASERVLSGDRGLAVSAELTTPEVAKGLRFLGFVDAGWLRSLNTGASSSGKPARDQLASAGLGFRYTAGTLSLTADWGRIITGATAPADGATSTQPKVGEDKLHVSLTARF
ncbi:ShlB/FhaC/HecB family hemolysin secretion/activation protein [Rhodoferax sp.]|uniref:ShlB/FhaC/HecB family hemolysin secretion/activation protein n=1 Tax=Rhodoferax sp. TaxID=50421 RepID=UPI00378360CC